MIRPLIIISTALILFNSCKNPPKKGKVDQHNFIVLIDLSDRLIEQDQVERDLNTIEKIIWPEFLKIVKSKVYVKSKDAFQIVFANQENSIFSSTELFTFQDSLSIDLSNELVRNKKNKTDYFNDNFGQKLKNIYNKASFSNNKDDYHGADIYKYFNEELPNEIVKSTKENKVFNHVFILTDGYLYIKGQSDEMTNSFPIVNQKFNSSEVDVCLLELNPKSRYKDELQRLKIVWSNWFVNMGIHHVQYNNRTSLDNTRNKLHDFIINPKEYLVTKESKIKPKILYVTKIDDNEKKTSVKFKNTKTSIQVITKKKEDTSKEVDYSKLNDQNFVELFLTKGIYKGNNVTSNIKRLSSLFEYHFPDKGSLNYLYLCSSKDILLNQLKKSGVHSPNLESKLKLLCH
jgi:hypothetical protein